MAKKTPLPIGTYVILGLLLADMIFAGASSSGLPLVFFMIVASYVLMLLKQRWGLILFTFSMVFLLAGILLYKIYYDIFDIWNIIGKIIIPSVFVSIALIFRRKGVSAFRIIWGQGKNKSNK